MLTELLGVQVLDRCGLILDIFAQRAKTKEGRLQVELAQYQYLLPRLTGMWTHLERQAGTSGKGPIGSKGPGETQLETDRRHIRRKIDKLREDLEEVRRVRSTQRQRRQKNEIPVVAIVGYTNAGKSTLLNHLTGAGIPANNRLFDTLDTTSRLLTVSDTLDVVISDTVGFIRRGCGQAVGDDRGTPGRRQPPLCAAHPLRQGRPAGPAVPGGQGGERGVRGDHRGHGGVHAEGPGADGAVPCGMSAPRPAPVRRPSRKAWMAVNSRVLSSSSRN